MGGSSTRCHRRPNAALALGSALTDARGVRRVVGCACGGEEEATMGGEEEPPPTKQAPGSMPWINPMIQTKVALRENDVIVSVPPKSGTTWSMNIGESARAPKLRIG